MVERMPAATRWLLALLLLDAFLLAVLELFFLPLRLDGLLLPDLGGFPVPLTVLVAAATTPLLVARTGQLVRPGLSVLPLVVWVLTLLVVGLFGPGGDVVLVQDWRSVALLACGALPGAVALGGTFGLARAQVPNAKGERRG
jgi:hypothetical protein